MNKKGGVPDGIFYLIALFAVAMISITGFMIFDKINTNMQGSNAISNQGKTLMNDLHGKYVGLIDSAFLMIFVGVFVGTIVGVWFIKTHPALFWIMIPIFAFIIFLGAVYGNVFYAITDDTAFTESASQFTIIPFIFNNYVYIITGVVFFIAVALFAKGRSNPL